MAAVASALSGMVSGGPGGSTEVSANTGKNATPGSGVKGGVQRAPQPPPPIVGTPVGQPRQARQTPPRAAGRPPGAQAPPSQKRPQFSAKNPMMMVQPPPTPHPGLKPPYPDARSPQPTMAPNGQVVMPAPPSPLIGSLQPRVPMTFIPGMTGLLGGR